jgi:peptide deformylase
MAAEHTRATDERDAAAPAANGDSPREGESAEAPEQLDPETRARRDAALRQVRKLGDPVLRTTALPVEQFDDALRSAIERMGELMRDALGVGLAANQVGVLQRVFVYRVDPEHPVTAVVNPVLESASEEQESAEEGCLSLPAVHLEVERPAQVRLRGRDAEGAELVVEASGLEARVIQHELDHLNGVLILDRVSREQRKEAMRAMREAMQDGGERALGGARQAATGGERSGARAASAQRA